MTTDTSEWGLETLIVEAMTAVLKDDTELFKQFMDNEGFRRWMTDTVFGLTYDQPNAP